MRSKWWLYSQLVEVQYNKLFKFTSDDISKLIVQGYKAGTDVLRKA
ncbi:hypothetical protein [Fibrella aquatilis]|uniref:Uncharacterized protein n=1 Tax=Fibrella aquatilis TaxID=2817059 RepID=A0A939G4J9_9BACT|nr:hypothetical protein [Fibrella aquatilis]MBO0930494.1 hypothetical protein [Fibrella aquatilis]